MDVRIDLAAAPVRLRFAGLLTIAAAAAGRTDLLALLPEVPVGPVQLDLAEVSEADGAGVQLVMATARSLRASGHAPRLGPCSPEVRCVTEALGVALEEAN
ncbi:MAG: STAS domain-containing protein [Rubrivivax sp.]